MRHLLQQAGLVDVVLCDSAGIIGYHAGEAPDARMREAARRRGLSMSGLARQVMARDLDRFDLIVAMDYDNYTGLMKLATERNRHKIRMFCSYCTRHTDREVPDPYYGNAAGFEYVLDLLEDGCAQIIRDIARTGEQEP